MDCSLLGSSVHGTSQARIQEWVAISSPRGSSQSRIKPAAPALAGGFFTPELPGKPLPSLLLPFSSLILPCDMIIVFLSYIPYRVKLLKLDLVPYFIFSKKNSNGQLILSKCVLRVEVTYEILYSVLRWETLGWKKHKLESRLPGEISITSDMQMIPPLWQKMKRN